MMLTMATTRHSKPNSRVAIVMTSHPSPGGEGFLLPMSYKLSRENADAATKPKVAIRMATLEVFAAGIRARIIVSKSAHVDRMAM